MPIYEYLCQKCKEITEVLHGYNESPEVKCNCGNTNLTKIISLPNLNVKTGTTLESMQSRTQQKYKTEMAQELRENYGVHEVSPLGNTYDGVYKEIKSQGTRVKDQMQETTRQNELKAAQKRKVNRENFAKIKDQRIAELKQRKAEEAYNKRKIGEIK